MTKLALSSVAAFCVGFTVVSFALAEDCKPVDVSEFGQGIEVTKVTPGQYHFLQGVYAAWPLTDEGLPPGDGALVVTKPGEATSFVIYTRGPLVCLKVKFPSSLVKLLEKISGEDL